METRSYTKTKSLPAIRSVNHNGIFETAPNCSQQGLKRPGQGAIDRSRKKPRRQYSTLDRPAPKLLSKVTARGRTNKVSKSARDVAATDEYVNAHADLVALFTESKFGENVEIAADVQPADLQNNVCPVFRRSNFPRRYPYHVLLPSLRLASRLLRSRRLEPLLCTILDHGQLHDVAPTPDGRTQQRYSAQDSRREMPRAAAALALKRAELDTAFAELAELVRFRSANNLGEHVGAMTRVASARDRRFARHSFTGGEGRGSDIDISRQAINDLAAIATDENHDDSDDDDDDKGDRALLVWMQFNLGVTLAHVR